MAESSEHPLTEEEWFARYGRPMPPTKAECWEQFWDRAAEIVARGGPHG